MAEHQCNYEREMGSIQTNIDTLLKGQDIIIEKLDKQNGRVRKLEDWRTGIVAVGSFIILLLGFLKWLL